MAWKVPQFIQAEFSKTYPSFLTLKEGSTFLTKPLFPQGRENVAGSAIAPPEFWSASGACALKGWLGVLTQQGCDCLSAGALSCAGWDRLEEASYGLLLWAYILQILG